MEQGGVAKSNDAKDSEMKRKRNPKPMVLRRNPLSDEKPEMEGRGVTEWREWEKGRTRAGFHFQMGAPPPM